MSASGHPLSGMSGVRRRIPRYPVAIPVDITVLRSGASASIPGRSLDLGEGGVAAVLAAELQLGESVGVQFHLPNAGQVLQTKAVVRHHNHLRCGFEFQGLSADQRSMIRSWAGNSPPLKSSLEPVVPVSVSTSTAVSSRPPHQLPSPCMLPRPLLSRRKQPPAPVSAAQTRRQPVSRQASDAYATRLLRLTVLLLVVVGAWAGMAMASRMAAAGSAHRRKRTYTRNCRQPNSSGSDGAVAHPPSRAGLSRSRSPRQSSGRRDARRMIAADGTVVNLHPRSGPDAFVSAAMDAARWWRFRPYRVRGEATTVETTLSVEFHL